MAATAACQVGQRTTPCCGCRRSHKSFSTCSITPPSALGKAGMEMLAGHAS